jgi:hypothetical protein
VPSGGHGQLGRTRVQVSGFYGPVASEIAETVTKSIVTLLEALNYFVYTDTYDNRKGFTWDETLPKILKFQTCYTKTFH